jgi:hypothetical protein
MGGMVSNITRNESLFLGEDRVIRFTVLDDANQPVDITGWQIRFYFKEREGGDTIFTHMPDIAPGTGGVLDVVLEREDTIEQFPGTYFYLLERIDPGNNNVLAYGGITLLAA